MRSSTAGSPSRRSDGRTSAGPPSRRTEQPCIPGHREMPALINGLDQCVATNEGTVAPAAESMNVTDPADQGGRHCRKAAMTDWSGLPVLGRPPG